MERKSVFILQVKINHIKYYLADLNMTLSKNFKDAVIFNKENSTKSFDGEIEKELEERYEKVVTCQYIEIKIDEII